MHEEIMYPVCPHRNVAAAYQRFLGPDSGGIERFFPDERANRTDGVLLIVRFRGRRAVNGFAHELRFVARAASRTLLEFNQALSGAWAEAAAAGLLGAREVALLAGRAVALLFGPRPFRLPA